MQRWLFIILCLTVVAGCRCGGDKTTQPKDAGAVTKRNEFINLFRELRLPYQLNDTAILRRADSLPIPYTTLQRFVPDTVLARLGMNTNSVARPMGRIENNGSYLLAAYTQGKENQIACLFFDEKGAYQAAQPLLNTKHDRAYGLQLDINKEPAFTVYQYKRIKNQEELYTRSTYAYNGGAKRFVEILKESNEQVATDVAILNPIDTLPRTMTLSGDYSKSKRDFVTLRDGSNGSYNFFLHFEKSATCRAELKGTLRMTDAKTAVYQRSGDPCIIRFSFSGNQVKVKEEGNCGNYRGIKCLIDATYKKE